MHEILGVFLERRDGIEGELVVGCDLDGGAGDNHGGEGFVGAEEVFGYGEGYGDEVGG